jgi:hypothetical protein
MPDPEIPAGAFDPPARPEGYDLPTFRAKELGLNVDAEADIALRQGLHAAGVDNWLASALYSVAVHEVTKDLTPASVQSDYLNSEMELRQRWGGETEKRVAMANAEARRVYDKLPASVTNGMSYREFMLVTGLANNRVAVEQLYLRAKARQH